MKTEISLLQYEQYGFYVALLIFVGEYLVSKLKCVFVAGALTLFAGAASAATLNFNVSKNWSSSGHTYGAATVTGATVDTDGKILTNNEKVASWSGRNGGLGICSARNCTSGTGENSRWDQHTIDGKNKREMALIDFGPKKVEISRVTFNYWDRGDDFDFASFMSLVSGSTPTYWREDVGEGINRSSVTFAFNPGTLVGSMFGFGADGSSDEFKLKSINYREISEVPVPAGAVLLLTGFAAFGAIRRRKNAA